MGLGLSEMLTGADPLEVEAIWERLYVGSAMNGRRGAVINAIGALDIALHDLRGKAAGKPCFEHYEAAAPCWIACQLDGSPPLTARALPTPRREAPADGGTRS